MGSVLIVRSRPLKPTSAGQLLLKHTKQLRLLRADLERDLQELAPSAPGGSREDERISIAINADSIATWADLCRAQALRKPGFISEERVTTLSADANVARSQMSKAQADLQAQRIQIDSLTTDIQRLEALLASARTDLQQAEVNLSRTDIHAPVAGLVGNRAARSGQYVQVGSHLLALVPDHAIWVQANFKETQFGRMQPGQKAELVFDSYPDQPIEGRVDSLFAASGAQFSLLPPDNATGNFTKVVQRIPVKLTFAADNPLAGKIRPGMSVEVVVDLDSAE